MTVVLCGSLGSTAAMWDSQLPVLGSDVVFVDHPGHGEAPVVEFVGIAGLAARVLDAVDGRFCFVGLSLGGAVGMHLAASHPERVERLVLACTSTRFGEPEQWRERAALVRQEGLEVIVDAVLSRWFGEGFPHVEQYRQMFLSVDPEGYARCCDALAGHDAAGDLALIAAPVLVVAGSADPTSPPADAEPVAAGITGARLAVIEGAHHLANVERPSEFNRLLKEFL